MKKKAKFLYSNRLIQEKSPYLLQHAHNPVHWYPWGAEALRVARKEEKVIFLSIGYSTCHWCHVMEHESFENEEIASIMNESFICIKVDREERPDLDNIYMAAVQMITGRGGWPLSIFLTPHGKPFFGGTYWPSKNNNGHTSFQDVLLFIRKIWNEQPRDILDDAHKFTINLQHQFLNSPSTNLDEDVLEQAFKLHELTYDCELGGFGNAPKFPQPNNLYFLLRYYKRYGNTNALKMVEKTLAHMAQGGMYDHLGGGFHRYSVDNKWLVPHFEKMLYDQALLARAYLEAYQITCKAEYADIAREIFTYVLRDMTAPSGGFYSAEDADSDGVEGKYYLWNKNEILGILGKGAGERFCACYGVTDSGNLQGTNILYLHSSIDEVAAKFKMNALRLVKEVKRSKKKLFEARSLRVRPLLDDKIVTAWNGLMISSLAFGARVLNEDIYARSAEKAAQFIIEKVHHNQRLLRRYCRGEAALLGYADDYAFFTMGLIDLYETTYKEHWLKEALSVNKEMTRLFWDKSNGGILFIGHDGEKLIANYKDGYDGATPSGNSVAALNYLRLGRITMNKKLEDRGHNILKNFSKSIKQQGHAYTYMLIALDFATGTIQEIVLSGKRDSQDIKTFHRCVNSLFLPNKVIVLCPDKDSESIQKLIPFIKGKCPLNSRATAYVCSNYTCKLPVTDVKELERMLKEL